MPDAENPNIIEASPTKELFIYMLVRDLPLIRAIIDLLDNSVDGAIRSGKSEYTDYWIRIEFDETMFKISDNCGGITIEMARHYAFRFGKPKDAEFTPGSIGQFGVGMKRTFFKLGRKFKVESTTNNSHFVIDEDVEKWKEKKEWNFEFKELNENLDIVNPERIGTLIEITSLYENISNEFKLENFQTMLFEELRTAHSVNMGKGLAITLNGIPLTARPLSVLQSSEMKPACLDLCFQEKDKADTKVKIIAGLAERNLAAGGWYIFCNGRMLLEAEQSIITGWGEDNGSTMPKYHPDFAFFRGYVFFESDDAGLLPWTTTKTGVDTDAPMFKSVRLEMINIMRPIIDFMRKLATERSNNDDSEDRPLEKAVKAAASAKYSDVETQRSFVAPKPPPYVRSDPPTKRIQYSKPKTEVDEVMKRLNITKLKDVGEKTFEYFYEMECN